MSILELRQVTKVIQGREVLKNVNISLEAGEICALVGPNGAGKTTLFKSILGLNHITQGEVQFIGGALDLSKVGTILNYTESLDKYSTALLFEEHLCYMGKPYQIEQVQDLLVQVGLHIDLSALLSTFSLGMKQRLMLALAISHQPELLILDEPFNGLDMDGIERMKSILKNLQQAGVTVLISSHTLSELEDLVSHVCFISEGKVSPKETIYSVVENYKQGLKGYYQEMRSHHGTIETV